MRQCTHCRAELPDHAQFCSHCGTSVIDDQPQSVDDPYVDMEHSQDASLEQRQTPATFEDSEAALEELAQTAEDQSSEAVQQSAEMASTEESGDTHANRPADGLEDEEAEEKTLPPPMSPPTGPEENAGDDGESA